MAPSGKSYADRNHAIFDGQDPDGVLWQPRLEYWYAVNKKRGTLPTVVKDADILDVYTYCHASVRYFGNGLRVRHQNVTITDRYEDAKRLRRTWETPVGTLTDVRHYDEWDLSAHNTEYKLKTADDFRIMEYMLQNEEWYWDQEAHAQSMARFGAYGAPQFFFRRSPIQGLFIEHMGLESALYLMYDQPDVIQHYVEVASAADDALYQVLAACPVRILNFGENIDAHMDPPSIWRNHLIPYYTKRTEQMHAAGKRMHIHIDGAMKPILPYLRDCPWDGIEAATPVPQGDVTIEEIKRGLGDLVLLDGIPALFFLPSFPEKDLVDCVKRLVELFYPRLVLGISDEIPPDGDLERVRMVGELVQTLI
ncbi:MAG: uroporphyrinogen decarboxylase family protein [Anaerolineae bacterium]